MKPAFRRFLVLMSLVALLPARAFTLANNVVRADDFEWMKVETEHFDIYYDKKTEALVPRMAHHVERAWREVGDKFGYSVPERTPFFFYSDHNKFEQTNIAYIGEGTGGVTEALKNRLVIFNDGSDEWLRHVIYHEFVHVLEFNVLYSGLFRSVQLFVKSPFYPLWMMEGMAEWGSGNIDESTTNLVIRDAVANNMLPDLAELHGFSHLKPNQITLGYKTGEVALTFLEDEYGQEKVLSLLSAMRDHFDISAALELVIGADLGRFDFRFREWTTDKYAADIAASKRPADYGPRLTGADGIPLSNEAPAFSLDGRRLYYLSDKTGPTRAYEMNLETRESKPLFAIDWMTFENIHTQGRGLSVSRDGRWLALAGEKGQRDFLFLYDTEKRKLRRVHVPFDEIRSPVFSPTDDALVCVGLDRGYTDLYLIDRKGQVKRRLTNSPQHESDPTFSPDGERVVYSGEVLTSDLSGPAGRDLYSINVVNGEVTQLTSFEGEETDPEILPNGTMVFVRDRDDSGRRGYELFRLDPGATSPQQLTRLVGGAVSPRYSPSNQKIHYVGFNAGERHVYQGDWDLMAATATAAVSMPSSQPEQTAAVDDFDKDEDLQSEPVSTISALEWPANNESALLRGPARPYRFRGSTDLFLPFFLYSTQSGFAAVAIWQYSDMLNNHTIQQQLQYASGSDFYDVASFYTYSRFRPNFTIGASAERYYRDFDEQEQRREVNGVFIMDYPLSRVNSVLAGVGGTDRQTVFLDGSELDEDFQDRFYTLGFLHDTVTLRYLIPTRGNRFSAVYQRGADSFGGNQSYNTGQVQAVQYAPLPRESTLATRLFYGRSVGEDPQVFRIGGSDRIRALSATDANKKTNAAYGSAELRLRISYLNARTKFLFPDFFFKAAYLIAFDDFGYGWNNAEERDAFKPRRLENSAGLGISWPTFILQTFKLDFTILWARQTTESKETWYVTLGPSF